MKGYNNGHRKLEDSNYLNALWNCESIKAITIRHWSKLVSYIILCHKVRAKRYLIQNMTVNFKM